MRGAIVAGFVVLVAAFVWVKVAPQATVADIAELHTHATSGFFHNFRGHPVFYRDIGGEGRPLVLLHGFPSSAWDWHRVWDCSAAAGEGFRLLAPDLLGHGLSTKARDFPLSIMANADMVDDWLAALGVRAYDLFCHDLGDSVCQELLARHAAPNSTTHTTIRSAVLLNGGVFPGTHRPLLVQWLLANPVVGPVLRHFVVRPVFDRSFSKVFALKPTAADLDQHWALVSHGCGTCVVDKVLQYMHERVANKQRWEGALFSSTCAVHLINGGLDPVSGAHVVDAWHAREAVEGSGNRPPVLLPHVGHYPHLEDPAAVCNAFAAFHTTPQH